MSKNNKSAPQRQSPPQQEQAEAPRAPTRLEKLVDELILTEEAANINLDYESPKTIQGKAIAKREAQEKLGSLLAQYEEFLLQGLAAIFTVGDADKQARFAKLASDEGSTITVECDSLYQRLADEVEGSMRTDRLFEPSQFARLLSAVSTVAKELKIAELPVIKYRDGAMLKTREDLVDHIRYLVRDALGDSLNRIYLSKKIVDAAMKSRYRQSVVPVVVTGATQEETEGLAGFFNKRVVIANVQEDVTSEYVIQTFNDLKKQLKKT